MSKPFNSDEMIASYLSQGGYHFNGQEVLKDFDYEAFMPRNRTNGETDHLNVAVRLQEYNLHQLDQIRQLQHRISSTLLKDVRHHIFYHDFYDMVYPKSVNWHFDIDLPDWKGYNASLNCYFEDSDAEANDPAVTFIPFDRDLENTTTPANEEHIHVKKFDMVLINQTDNFLHRVTRHDKKRTILMFGIALLDLPAKYPMPPLPGKR